MLEVSRLPAIREEIGKVEMYVQIQLSPPTFTNGTDQHLIVNVTPEIVPMVASRLPHEGPFFVASPPVMY